MTALFDRSVAITLSRPTAFFTQSTANQIRITDLRAQFKIVKHLKSEPNTCEITITNLSAASRAALQVKPLHVRVDAGYAGQLENLFVGDLIWGESIQKNAEWLTTLLVGDGTRSRSNARSSRTFKSGVNVKTVIGDLAKSAGLKLPTNAKEAAEMTKQFSSGVTVDGPTHREMDRILKPTGFGWSVQNGTLQLIKDGDAFGEAFVINQDTGMIGSPEHAAPKKEKSKPVLTVRSLLRGSILPGRKMLVQAKNVTGLFRANRVEHVGDTSTNDWFTIIEGTAV